MSWLLICRSYSIFFKDFITFFSDWPSRTRLIFDIKISRMKASELFACCLFCYSIFNINSKNFNHKPGMRCRLCQSGILKYSKFPLYSGPFFILNSFWYTTPISVKFCGKQSFKCHLSNAHLVLLMPLAVTELYLLLTPSVRERHELFLLAGHKVDFIFPYEAKSIFWPSRK